MTTPSKHMCAGRFWSAVSAPSNAHRDPVEAFILVEEPDFAEKLGLVVVGLNRPGLGSPAFVAELTSRLPAVPVLVLGCNREDAALYPGENVRFLLRTVPTEQMLAVSRQMMDQYTPRVA